MSMLRLRWAARFQELKDFNQEHGNCDVPASHPGGLGKWVKVQRAARKRTTNGLSACRVQKLDELGFKWNKRNDAWEARLQELKDFSTQRRHCDVPTKYPGGLGRWVSGIRLRRSTLDPRRVRQLEDMGFRWRVHEDHRGGTTAAEQREMWDERFDKLKQFKLQHGHCNVPLKHPGGLGRWVERQRAARRAGKTCLDAHRIQRLEAEGFQWQAERGRGAVALAEPDGTKGDGPVGSEKEAGRPTSDKEGEARPAPTAAPEAPCAAAELATAIVSERTAAAVDDLMRMYRQGQESARVDYESGLRALREQMEGLQRECGKYRGQINALQEEVNLLRKEQARARDKSAES